MWNDEGPDRGLFDPNDESVVEVVGGSAGALEDARVLDSLLAGEELPPARVWADVQAKLRQEGIIR